ncbi:MAG: SHOCT domain-containing protein [Bacteroidales bacterium]|nr:SHOCT domain-containing protein [Bacteroidales bacterium]
MKGKSLVSVIAVIFILGAIGILLKNIIPDLGDMGEEGWMWLLGVLGVLLAIIALVVRGNSSEEKSSDDEVEPSEELKLKHTEFKLQELRKNGILSETEYQQKLSDARLKSGGYKKTVENLKALLDAGLLTKEEYDKKANEAYERSKNTPSTDEPITSNDPADKVARLMELREAELITQQEFEEQMSKI